MFGGDVGLDRVDVPGEDLAGVAVDADLLALGQLGAVGRHLVPLGLDTDIGAADDGGLAEAAGDDGGVAGDAAAAREDGGGAEDAGHVVGAGLGADEDDGAGFGGLGDGGRLEDGLAGGGARARR